MDPDTGLEALRKIIKEFTEFCAKHSNVSEADTRAKVIDKVLVEVLGWPESAISREGYVARETIDGTEKKFLDYSLSVGSKPTLVVEAKAEDVEYVFPVSKRKSYSLDGTLVSDKNLKQSIYQVRGYCDDEGIRFAVATNGYAWIVFRAVRDDMPWRKGSARVFESLESIENDFTAFFNLLSYKAVKTGSLQEEFSSSIRASRKLLRVVDGLFNADLPLARNRLNSALQTWINFVFEDIADQEHLDVLNECYVHTGSLRRIASQLGDLFYEVIPQFLYDEGTVPTGSSRDESGFEQSLSRAMGVTKGQLFLLLGPIGSGKSTFLKRYQRTIGAQLLEEKTLSFRVDFLGPPTDPTELANFVWKTVLDRVRKDYAHKEFEKRSSLHQIFKEEITAIESTILLDMKRGSHKYNSALSPYLNEWQKNLDNYVPKLIRKSCERENLAPVLFIDNVDQLSPAYQANIFLLAQRVVRILNGIAIVALREESYYSASIQNTFTAYTNRKFHIAAPLFRKMIGLRIRFALKAISESGDSEDDWEEISQFLRIVEKSIFGTNRNLVRFIEAICLGNMRFALHMFTTFLTSGATDVGKMLAIASTSGSYNVPFHEFIKSIMLEDRAYYKEDASQMMNIFNVGAHRNSSHFTTCRLISVLLSHKSESTSVGRGFVNLEKLIGAFEDCFDNREDVVWCLNRLVQYRLAETTTRSSETVNDASHVRVTSAGWYYLRYLARAFAYLDLVLQDTPIDSEDVHTKLRKSVRDVDNLAGSAELKLARVRTRFARVENFLDYLKEEESIERDLFSLESDHGPFGAPIIDPIRKQYENEKSWIEKRLAENAEHVEDEAKFDVTEEEEGWFSEMLEEAREQESS